MAEVKSGVVTGTGTLPTSPDSHVEHFQADYWFRGKLVGKHPEWIWRLQQNARQLKRGLRQLGLETDDSPAPIVCLTLRDAATMQRIQATLMSNGILIAYQSTYARLPPAGALRIAVFATHTDTMIERLIDTMRKVL